MKIPITPVESNFKGLIPNYIADMYLNNNFLPIFGSKNLNYYQAILKETHSIVIEVTDRSNKDIAFSKFLIRKVLTPQEWGSELIQFTIYYNIPWWNYRIFCKIEKKFSIQMTEPYLFRQNYLRWWNKFDFFDKKAVYTKRGVIVLTPPTAPMKPMSPYQDSQYPCEEDSNDSLMELTQHLGKT
ncbi:hypothetical protein CDL12_08656 [Handroanthus impetiginosus]|uniref:Uncharacterized protein n=1 Tax=Handroanthus impetiginosus TaxID=429701 RepID=A0A2G9HMA7_9LAMI|nr:hypothetical protein CDL12_08656 [Handroanthus impetiginosus]